MRRSEIWIRWEFKTKVCSFTEQTINCKLAICQVVCLALGIQRYLSEIARSFKLISWGECISYAVVSFLFCRIFSYFVRCCHWYFWTVSEAELTYNNLYMLKMYNLICFYICIHWWNHHHIQDGKCIHHSKKFPYVLL